MQNPSSPSSAQPPPPPSSPFPPSSSSFNFRDPKSILFIILAFSLISLLLILSLLSSSSSPSSHSGPDPFLFPSHQTHRMVFDQSDPSPAPPSIAYLISGSRGDSGRILRLLFATYHPRNHYLLHLDPSAPHSDRVRLALAVQSNPIFRAAQNVDVIGKPDFAYFKGSSPVSFTLHGASILLRLSQKWNWFISLTADAYPLVTQDGSPFSILSRRFLEFCILGEDNLPRILLMYFANTPKSLSSYFSTVLCNSRPFSRTVVNQNLLYDTFDKPLDEPRALNSSDFDDMINSGAAFARKFHPDDSMLDLIDNKVLGRSLNSVVPGGWCLGEPGNETCLTWGDANILRPGPGSRRLEKAIVSLLSNGTFRSRQCKVE